jgi:adenylate cyclase
LTAILSADVKGYSRLMGEDELSTVETLKRYREIISTLVQQFSGRVVDSPGDNILAEFSSVVDAVECAVKIQGDLQEANANLPENRRMEFRIGVNLGDVIDDEGRIYGDGVNVAARVEGLAEAGGICISRKAFDEVKNKLSLGYEYLGDHSVKNITEPVRVYKVLTEHEHAGKVIGEKAPKPKHRRWAALAAALIIAFGVLVIWHFYFRPPPIEPASVEKMAFPLPEKPSIAVLPFDNLSGDPKQTYLTDGLTENIISGLSKIPEMFVIARNSTFTYKDKPVKVQQVAEELGVRYVLEGSMQISADQLRVTAQLIDALKGHHVWSEKYDRKMEHFFSVQDDITLNIAIALQVKLTEGEQARVRHSTENLEAWALAVEAHGLLETYARENVAKARELFKKAVELDPNYVYAWTFLGWTFWVDGVYHSAHYDREESFENALKIANKALRIDSKSSDAHVLFSLIYITQKKYDEAEAFAKKAIDLDPNSSENHGLVAITMQNIGKFEEAIALLKQAMRLDPYYPNWYLIRLGMCYRMVGMYEESVAALKEGLRRFKKGGTTAWDRGYLYLAATYSMMGRLEEARDLVSKALEFNPKMSVDAWRKRLQYKDPKHTERILDALRKAGLPETPPLPLPDKPSIAVLPFTNMSADPDQEYFSDGMTDDLITDLSKISGLFVIARNSTFQYKGTAVDVKEVSRELGIRYVLEGSVRKAGDKVRINAQLIDATTGGHMWAERYDGQMEDIFSLQDKIAQKIVAALAVKLTSGEKENLASKGTDNIEAYDAFLKGWQHYLQGTPESFAQAIADFEKAIEFDPDFSRAYAALALVHLKAGSSKKWYQALRTDYFTLKVKARHFLNIAMKKPTSLAYRVASSMELKRRNHDKALQNAEKAITVNPTDAESQFAMAEVLVYSGRPKEAMKIIDAVMRLDPNKMADCLKLNGIAHFCLGEYEEAIASFNRSLKYNPESYVHNWLASAHANIGNDNDARAAFEIEKKRWLEVSAKGETATITKLDLQPTVYSYPFKDPGVMRRFVDGLIKAGWPEPHRYYAVYKENKLTGDEIRDLVVGKTQVLAGFAGGGWTQKLSEDGSVVYKGYGIHDTGVYRIEGDQCCITYDKMLASLPLCVDLYRNPGGTVEKKDEYIQVNDFGMYPVSYID